MKRIRVTLFLLGLAVVMMMACQSPRIEPKYDGPVLTFLDVPVEDFNEQTEKYLGVVFEDRFNFDPISPAHGTTNPVKQGQVFETRSHVAAKPIAQDTRVIQIWIAPAQEEWVRKRLEAEGNYVIKARVRFVGIAPGGQPAFDLMAILE